MRGTSFLHREPEDITRLVRTIQRGDIIFAYESDRNWGFFEVTGGCWAKRNSWLVEIDSRSFPSEFHSGISVDFSATLDSGAEIHAVAGEDVRAVYKTREGLDLIRDQVVAATKDYDSALRQAKLKLEMAIAIIQQDIQPS